MGKYKVVVNGCYGGFGVSERGAEWLLANGANRDRVSIKRAEHEGGYVYVYVSLDRHDPLLVRMVIELGSDAASGSCDIGRHASGGIGVDNKNTHGASDFSAQIGGFDTVIGHQGA